MADTKLLDGMANFASSYAKRFLESHYDALMRTAPARKLMEAGAPTRYGTEAALYALIAYADQHWPKDTPLRKFIRDVAIDAPAEISKRLVNGFREEVLSASRSGDPNQNKSMEQVLLQLDDATLGALLAWLARLGPEERKKTRALLGTLSDAELQKVAQLTPEELTGLVGAAPTPAKPPSRLSRAIKDELEAAIRRADEELAIRRKGRQP